MSETKKFELTSPMAIVVAGVIIAGAIIYTNTQAAAPSAAAENLPQDVSVTAPSGTDHRYGSANAPVVLIEYSDFECPYCALVHPTLKRLVDESQGKVAWVYRHLPLESIHAQARPAALAAECAAEQLGDTAFFAFADAIFANQSSMGTGYYAQLAGELGADTAAFAACVASNKYAERVDAHAGEAAAAGAQGTPFTVVHGNGRQVPVGGALPYEQFKAVIDAVMGRQ